LGIHSSWLHTLQYIAPVHMCSISEPDASFELLAQGLATYVFVVKTSSVDAWRPTLADSVNDRIVGRLLVLPV